jgi:hypothetical protein
MPRCLRDGGALCRSVDGLARREPARLEYAARVAAALAERLAAERVHVRLDEDDGDLSGLRLRAVVLGEVVTAAGGSGGAALSAPVVVFGVPVGTLDAERSGVYDWTVRDLAAARDHARMIGVALEWLLAKRPDGEAGCRSTA